MNKLGNLHLILGCMFSGKTTELIKRVKKYESIKKRVMFVNYIGDTRYGNDKIYTHSNISCEGYYLDNLSTLLDEINNYDVFAINEGQFFEDISIVTLILCENYGKDVIICGLDGDYKREIFRNNLLNLIPYADTVEILTAYCIVCKDETPARFSKRITDEKEQTLIGVSNYIPVCRKHYLN